MEISIPKVCLLLNMYTFGVFIQLLGVIKMTGKVTKILDNGFIEIRGELYVSVVELLGDYQIEIGDKIKGDLDCLGEETLYNISKDEEIDAFIQDLK